MAENNGGPINAARALVDGVLGVAKQVVGIVFGNKDLQEAGKAQQDKAEAEKDVAKKEAAAEGARAKAKAAESAQEAAAADKS